jgi:hypothetical protein
MSSAISSLLLCLPNLFLKSISASALSIGSIAIMSRCSTNSSAALLLRVVIRIDLFGHCGRLLKNNRYIDGKSIYWRLTVCRMTRYKRVKCKNRWKSV